jgi:hypothetical protein
MRIGQVIRYPASKSVKEVIDGLQNWYFLTAPPPGSNWPKAMLDSGINTSAMTKSSRIPYLALRSSPHRFGSRDTPWEDIHRPDQGYSRYFGDAKPGNKAATDYLGNQRMLDAFIQQQGDWSSRLDSPPVLIFEAVEESGREKGQFVFHGLAVISRAELVVQSEPKGGRGTFPNYVFELAHLDLAPENETLDWSWINDRRDSAKSALDALSSAPQSWRTWVENGSLGSLRRSVITRGVVTEKMQRPANNSEELKLLKAIYSHYQGRQHRFEGLAEFVIQQIFEDRGIEFKPGWITQGSGDGGFDFVGSVDLDPVGKIRASRQVLLGQAKCEKLDRPTNGLHIARLAARLRRGWLGAYVTTSWFSMPVQREILTDRYPVVLVDGLRLSEVIRKHLTDTGKELHQLLGRLDSEYEHRLGYGDPETVLIR